MNGDFDKALPFILRFEGGYSDVLDDKGGPTMNGVTQETYNDYRDLIELPRAPVSEITAGEVEDVYERLYWERLDLRHVSWPVSLILFDFAVNQGVGRARTAMGVLDEFAQEPKEQAEILLALRLYLYRREAATNAKQRKFLLGWENRVASLRHEAGV